MLKSTQTVNTVNTANEVSEEFPDPFCTAKTRVDPKEPLRILALAGEATEPAPRSRGQKGASSRNQEEFSVARWM